jgi:hypothetical protein
VRLVVLLITAIALVAGACTSADAPQADIPASTQLKQTKSLPAALATARRTGSLSDLRLPTFTLPPVALPQAPRGAVAQQDVVDRSGYLCVHPPSVTARGPPRG